jgi:hypothetical protein
MRLIWNCGVLVLLVSLAVGSKASAQTGARKLEKAELVKELRAAHKLLAEADRDYKGHRAQAAKEVHKAIKELGGEHHPKKAEAAAPGAKPPRVKQPAIHEPQATSDAQLRQAQAILEGVQAELNAHHPKAAANVTAAIAEIKTALSIK